MRKHMILALASVIPLFRCEAGLRGVNTTNIFVSHERAQRVFRIIERDTFVVDGNFSTVSEDIAAVPIVGGRESDDLFSIDLPKSLLEEYDAVVAESNLFLSITNTRIVSDEIILHPTSKISVTKDPRVRSRKHRPPALGKKSIAVVRISTIDAEPSDSVETLKEGLFGENRVNLMTQYEACSFGKLQFYLSDSGIIDVLVPARIKKFKSGSSLVHEAQRVMKTELGIRDVSKLADKVLMCLPPGTGKWVASSGVNHWRAQFNDGWCRSLTATMHELGHTLGLNHANKNGKSYGDSTGYMAAGHRQTNWPRKCFNGQKNWQLGWYYNRQETIRISALEKGSLIKLAAFVDYDIADYDEPVLLNVADSFFLQFNMAKKFNVDTEEKKDKVTITAPTGGGSDSIEGLGVGDVYTKFFFDKTKRTLIIEACNARKGRLGADIMVISVAFDRSLCGNLEVLDSEVSQAKVHFAFPTKQPVQQPTHPYIGLPLSMLFSTGSARIDHDPTLSPITKSPTNAPSTPPNPTPTVQPTRLPAVSPTRPPTSEPTETQWSRDWELEPVASVRQKESRLWQLIHLMKTMSAQPTIDSSDPTDQSPTASPDESQQYHVDSQTDLPLVAAYISPPNRPQTDLENSTPHKPPSTTEYSSGITSVFKSDGKL